MSSSDSYYIELFSNIILYLYRYGNPVIFILGNVGNLLSAFVLFKKAWRKNVCVLYFKFCLLLSSAYLNSVILGNIFTNGFNINLQNSNTLLCKLFFYTSFVISTLLPAVLVVASIDRLSISSQNVDTRLYSSKRLAYFSISISTIFWIILNIHILIKVNIQVINSSIFICYYDRSKLYADFIAYSTTIFTCVFCVLILILSILSFKNVRRIRAIPRRQRNQIRTMTKKDFQLLRCLFVHDIVYIITSMFPSAYSIYAVANGGHMPTVLGQAIDDFFKSLSTFCYFTFFSSSFFIFLGVSNAFRHELQRMVYKLSGQHLLPSREEDNGQKNIPRNNVEVNVIYASAIVPSGLIIE